MSEQENDVVVLDDGYVAPFPDDRAIVEAKAQRQVVAENAFRGVAESNQGSAMAAGAMAEARFRIEQAKAFPRDQDLFTVNVAKACRDPDFAAVALYAYPRGRTIVRGASIKLAEELARHYGNLDWGYQITNETKNQRTIRCYATDLENNIRRSADVTFEKLIQRKRDGGVTEWVEPDERELLELTNRQAAKAMRNAILGLIPDSLKRKAMSWCQQTVALRDKSDPNAWKQELLLWFSQKGIKPQDIRDLMGVTIEQITNDEDRDYLRGVANRLKMGDARWPDIIKERAEALGLPTVPTSAAELRKMVSDRAEGVASPGRTKPRKEG